jgi:NADH:ubiquinone oxidoreductase subunit H
LPIFPKTDKAILTLLLISVFVVIEWLGRTDKFAIEKIGLQWPLLARWTFYAFIVFAIGMFMQTEETPFIYFQF